MYKDIERNQIIEALNLIRDVCIYYNNCEICPLREAVVRGSSMCRLNNGTPENWVITEHVDFWRAFIK